MLLFSTASFLFSSFIVFSFSPLILLGTICKISSIFCNILLIPAWRDLSLNFALKKIFFFFGGGNALMDWYFLWNCMTNCEMLRNRQLPGVRLAWPIFQHTLFWGVILWWLFLLIFSLGCLILSDCPAMTLPFYPGRWGFGVWQKIILTISKLFGFTFYFIFILFLLFFFGKQSNLPRY